MFRALSSNTRLEILKILSNKEIHLSGLARELNISVPVTSKHIKILENVGLVNKRIFGNTHLLAAKTKNLETALEPFVQETNIEVKKKKSLFDALKQIPGVEVKKHGKNQYIKSIDGEEGYYIYEVNGDLPEKPINDYIINKNISLDLKKIVSIKKKKINIMIEKR